MAPSANLLLALVALTGALASPAERQIQTPPTVDPIAAVGASIPAVQSLTSTGSTVFQTMPDNTGALGAAPSDVPINPLAYSGAGAWNYDYDYLGCSTGTWSGCSSPVSYRYSPENFGNNWYTAQGGRTLEVKLLYPFTGVNFDLMVEKWDSSAKLWKNFKGSTSTGNMDKVVIYPTQAKAHYRFKAYRKTGAGYYVLSWKEY